MIESGGLVLAPDDGSVPIETVLDVFRVHPEVLNGRSHDARRALSFDIEHLNRALITSAED